MKIVKFSKLYWNSSKITPMTKSIGIYGNSDELTTIFVQTSVDLGSLKTLSHEVGIIQCSANGLTA